MSSSVNMEAVRAAYQSFTDGNLDRLVESIAADFVSRQAAVPAGLLFGLFGLPLFGIVPAIVLIMFFASAIRTPARSRGSSPRLGLLVGFLVLAIVTLVIKVAVR